MKSVRKRDGRLEPFDQKRITNAVWNAAKAVGGKDHKLAKDLSDGILGVLREIIQKINDEVLLLAFGFAAIIALVAIARAFSKWIGMTFIILFLIAVRYFSVLKAMKMRVEHARFMLAFLFYISTGNYCGGDLLQVSREMTLENAIALFEQKDNRAFKIFEALFRQNRNTFRQEVSEAIDTKKLGFDQCSTIALMFRQLKKYDISILLYRLSISKEEDLERRIEMEENPETKQQLISYKEEMKFSLGRDYNDLGILYIESGDKDQAKDLVLKAYNEDVKHQKLDQAALMPAYRNLSLILIWEAEIFYSNQEYFPSFLMAWISIELSLRRLWFKLLREQGYSESKKKWLGKIDVSFIIEFLYLQGGLTSEKSEIDMFRGRRNDMMHATGATPTQGEARRVRELALILLSKE